MMENRSDSCSICELSAVELINVKEMRNGWREIHTYRYCKECGFLELVNIPENMARYYENNYYTASKPHIQVSGIRAVFWSIRAQLYTTFLHPIWHAFAYNTILDWKHKLNISFQDDILDYGCGNGDILHEFHKHGFTNLHGLDPFLPEIKSNLAFPLHRGWISDFNFDRKFNLIMMHHSFEHMANQEMILNTLKTLLKENGQLFIRMPLVNEAFKKYREHWVQIDAPRHLGIHSRISFEKLAEKCGFRIKSCFFDSTSFQFTGSEQNKADIAFFEPNSLKTSLEKSIFSKDDIKGYEELANHYNREEKGDQAAFILELK
jgi:SAM-dependent methyltransferase